VNLENAGSPVELSRYLTLLRFQVPASAHSSELESSSESKARQQTTHPKKMMRKKY